MSVENNDLFFVYILTLAPHLAYDFILPLSYRIKPSILL